MVPYKEKYPVGSKVRIINLHQLQEFERTWKYHHTLCHDQIAYADQVAEVKSVAFYHGGDVLYELYNIPGIWHESCLAPASVGRAMPAVGEN
jgi:hypothetical protein